MTGLCAQDAIHLQISNLRIAVERVGTRVVARDFHARVEPLGPVRVTTHLGTGVLVSITGDAWVEVQLDGECRRDEYPIELVRAA